MVSIENNLRLTGDDLSQANDFVTGLQPGDLTKYMSVPWQADFNECSTQSVDVTYVYDYIGWLVPVWPNSTDTLQRAAIVGSVVRTIPHSGSEGTVHPAGVVASFYAVKTE